MNTRRYHDTIRVNSVPEGFGIKLGQGQYVFDFVDDWAILYPESLASSSGVQFRRIGRSTDNDLMEQFRSAGYETRGPKPLGKKDIQSFANALDRTIARCQKRVRPT